MIGQAATDNRTKIKHTEEALDSIMRSRNFAIRDIKKAHDQFAESKEEKIIEAIQTNKKANKYVAVMEKDIDYINEIGLANAKIKKMLGEMRKQLIEAEKKINNTENFLLTKELEKAGKSNMAANYALEPIGELVEGIRVLL